MTHVAIVTGANHGIGAAIATALARRGDAVLCTYLRVSDPEDPGTPQAHRDNRARDAAPVVAAIAAEGGRAVAVEADLTDPEVPARLFGLAEERFGPVDILINNATGWLADSFAAAASAEGAGVAGGGGEEAGAEGAAVEGTGVERTSIVGGGGAGADVEGAGVAAAGTDRLGRTLAPVTVEGWRQQFGVDAMGAALLIAEFACRHIARGAAWGRIVGLTSGAELGFPQEVSYGAAKAAQVNYTMSAAVELAPYGITANMVHPPVTDTGWITDAVREVVANTPTLVHVAHPDEVAAVIAYLASDAATLITGNLITLR